MHPKPTVKDPSSHRAQPLRGLLHQRHRPLPLPARCDLVEDQERGRRSQRHRPRQQERVQPRLALFLFLRVDVLCPVPGMVSVARAGRCVRVLREARSGGGVVGSGEWAAGSPLERVGKVLLVGGGVGCLGGLGKVGELLAEGLDDGVHAWLLVCS